MSVPIIFQEEKKKKKEKDAGDLLEIQQTHASHKKENEAETNLITQ
jgi:hypothetical protein